MHPACSTENRDHDSVPPPSAPPAAFDVAAVASVAGFRDSCGNVPLDATVPSRTSAPIPTGLSLRATFVLLHVDGVASLQRIAAMACLSLPDTIEAFLQLLLLGVVEVPADADATAPPAPPLQARPTCVASYSSAL
jgi:hypothetical protein